MPTVTQNLTVSQVPALLAPPAPVSRSSAITPSSPGTIYGTLPAFVSMQQGGVADQLNWLLNEVANVGVGAGNGHGIVSGLELNAVSGLTGSISEGVGMGYGSIPVDAATFTLPDNTSLVFLWVKVDGSAQPEVTLTPPGGAAVYVGAFTTASGNITAIDTGGVPYIAGAGLFRVSGDRCQPTDTPPANLLVMTKTQSGSWSWDGTSHRPRQPVYQAVLTGDLQLTANDLGLLALDPGTADRAILYAPDPVLGNPMKIANSAAPGGHSLHVKDVSGTRTVATLSPGKVANLGDAMPGPFGQATYPTTVTPIGGYSQVLYDAATDAGSVGSPANNFSKAITIAGDIVAVLMFEFDSGGSASTITGITCAGVAMVQTAAGVVTANNVHMSKWILSSPTIGLDTILATFSASTTCYFLIVSAFGASGNIGQETTSSGASGTNAGLNLDGAPGDLVVDAIWTVSPSATSSTTLRDSSTAGGNFRGASTAPAGVPTAMGYTLGGSAIWNMQGLVIQAA